MHESVVRGSRPLARPVVSLVVAALAAAALLAPGCATTRGGGSASKADPAHPAALIGTWRGTDSDRWVYDLVLRADGSFSQTIDQAGNNTCVQIGTWRVDSGEFTWSYDRNACNEDYTGRSDTDRVLDQAADAFELDQESYTVRYLRVR